MKKLIHTLAFVLPLFFFAKTASAQTTDPASFTGATPTKEHYKALYILNSGDEKKMGATLRNLNNAMEDPRLKGKLEVELVVFGDGVAVFMKSGTFEQQLKALQAKGVILAQCSNTVRERKIDKALLFDFISYVPSGNGEIILRDAEGWATIHP